MSESACPHCPADDCCTSFLEDPNNPVYFLLYLSLSQLTFLRASAYVIGTIRAHPTKTSHLFPSMGLGADILRLAVPPISLFVFLSLFHHAHVYLITHSQGRALSLGRDVRALPANALIGVTAF